MDGSFERWSAGGQTTWSHVAASDEPARGADPVCDVMSAGVPAVPPWLSVEAARKVAALKAVDHLLVEQEGRLTGIVSGIDLDAASGETSVGALARPLTPSARPTTPLARARDLMRENGVGCLPVFAGVWLVGLVTRDAVERALRVSAKLPGEQRAEPSRRVALANSAGKNHVDVLFGPLGHDRPVTRTARIFRTGNAYHREGFIDAWAPRDTARPWWSITGRE
jgi:CBS domain-containing protein